MCAQITVNILSNHTRNTRTIQSLTLSSLQANKSYLKGPTVDAAPKEGLLTTTLGLEFRVEPKHFTRGDMKLKCLATIATVYWKTNEESVEGEKAQKSPAMEVKDTNKSRADRVQGIVLTAIFTILRKYQSVFNLFV